MDFRLGREPWNGIEPWTVCAVLACSSVDLHPFGEPCSDGQELAAFIEELRTEKCFSGDSQKNDEVAASLTHDATHGEYLAPGQITAEQGLGRQLDVEHDSGHPVGLDPTADLISRNVGRPGGS